MIEILMLNYPPILIIWFVIQTIVWLIIGIFALFSKVLPRGMKAWVAMSIMTVLILLMLLFVELSP